VPVVTTAVLHAERSGLDRVDLTGSGLPYYDVESAVQASLVP